MRPWSLPALVVLLAPVADGGEVTYSKDVAPILYKNCTGCHRPGEVGPFSLLTYKDAARRAGSIREVTADRSMPPWKPAQGFGKFHDARRLDDAEIAAIARWADAGSPEGDPRDLSPAPIFPEGWQLGTPDLVLKVSEPYDLAAGGPDQFRCFVMPTGVEEDRTVAAVEFRPGNRKVVHHALFFLDAGGKARLKDEADPKPGYATFGGIGVLPTGALGGWAPGATPRRLDDTLGMMLKKGSDLVLQVHYHPSGKPERDQSTVGIYYTKAKLARPVANLPLVNRDIDIPAGAARYTRTASVTVPTDVRATAIFPHMHWVGREMKVEATLPDGGKVPLIWITDWDFNWQGQYQFAEPVKLPKGTRVELTAIYDNSDANPKNPSHPPKAVRFGEKTEDEMCLCGLQVVPDSREGYAELQRAALGSMLGGGGPRKQVEAK